MMLIAACFLTGVDRYLMGFVNKTVIRGKEKDILGAHETA